MSDFKQSMKGVEDEEEIQEIVGRFVKGSNPNEMLRVTMGILTPLMAHYEASMDLHNTLSKIANEVEGGGEMDEKLAARMMGALKVHLQKTKQTTDSLTEAMEKSPMGGVFKKIMGDG